MSYVSTRYRVQEVYTFARRPRGSYFYRETKRKAIAWKRRGRKKKNSFSRIRLVTTSVRVTDYYERLIRTRLSARRALRHVAIIEILSSEWDLRNFQVRETDGRHVWISKHFFAYFESSRLDLSGIHLIFFPRSPVRRRIRIHRNLPSRYFVHDGQRNNLNRRNIRTKYVNFDISNQHFTFIIREWVREVNFQYML